MISAAAGNEVAASYGPGQFYGGQIDPDVPPSDGIDDPDDDETSDGPTDETTLSGQTEEEEDEASGLGTDDEPDDPGGGATVPSPNGPEGDGGEGGAAAGLPEEGEAGQDVDEGDDAAADALPGMQTPGEAQNEVAEDLSPSASAEAEAPSEESVAGDPEAEEQLAEEQAAGDPGALGDEESASESAVSAAVGAQDAAGDEAGDVLSGEAPPGDEEFDGDGQTLGSAPGVGESEQELQSEEEAEESTAAGGAGLQGESELESDDDGLSIGSTAGDGEPEPELEPESEEEAEAAADAAGLGPVGEEGSEAGQEAELEPEESAAAAGVLPLGDEEFDGDGQTLGSAPGVGESEQELQSEEEAEESTAAGGAGLQGESELESDDDGLSIGSTAGDGEPEPEPESEEEAEAAADAAGLGPVGEEGSEAGQEAELEPEESAAAAGVLPLGDEEFDGDGQTLGSTPGDGESEQELQSAEEAEAAVNVAGLGPAGEEGPETGQEAELEAEESAAAASALPAGEEEPAAETEQPAAEGSAAPGDEATPAAATTDEPAVDAATAEGESPAAAGDATSPAATDEAAAGTSSTDEATTNGADQTQEPSTQGASEPQLQADEQQQHEDHEQREAMGMEAGALGASQAATIMSNLSVPGLRGGGGGDSAGLGDGAAPGDGVQEAPAEVPAAVKPPNASDLGLTAKSELADYHAALENVPPDATGVRKIKIDDPEMLHKLGLTPEIADRLQLTNLLTGSAVQNKIGTADGLSARLAGNKPKSNALKDKSLGFGELSQRYDLSKPDQAALALDRISQVHHFGAEAAQAEVDKFTEKFPGEPIPQKMAERLEQANRNVAHLGELMDPEIGGERIGPDLQTVRFVVEKDKYGALFNRDVQLDDAGSEMRNADGSVALGPAVPIVEDTDTLSVMVLPGGNMAANLPSHVSVSSDPVSTSHLEKMVMGQSFQGPGGELSIGGQGNTFDWDPARDGDYQDNLKVKRAVLLGVANKGYLEEIKGGGWVIAKPADGFLPVPADATAPWPMNEFFTKAIPTDGPAFTEDEVKMSFPAGHLPERFR